uniref:Uncharacterized mitochondrial protein AtMg00810-like n=1 Tax=Tanacetum cinerariifolium TaxID=118510 RepID=A0A6L2JZX6_TANCI|nr:uncharacterized mitochondrial protein AtMg00810-like [Tanacetum cinerariifolium]
MFEKSDAQAQVWKNQKDIHGQVKVKSWKLLESCGVHIITFTTMQLILLIERRLTEGKLASTPTDTEKPLLKDPDGEDVDVHIYRSMIGYLMYLTSSRPDIMFAVCACARFQVTPKASHLYTVKRIFRYLKGKPHLGLWYLKDSPFDLVAHSDSDYAGVSLDIKSITGGCQFFGCRLISWQCKKQTVVATSSTEAEYVAAASCCTQVLWIQNQLLDYGEGFNQVIDFLNGSYIKYALTVNPTIYVSCIKQFWNTVAVKQSNDVTKLQALVDRKKVVITETEIREVLRLDDVDGVDCLPNKDIFAKLASMGYEKPSTKLTFYKAFFSSQWKFLIHTILQSISAKCTSWNKFSSVMASAVICLSTGRKFNFSKYIFESLVRNVDSSSKFYMYHRFIQLIIQNQLGDLLSQTTKYTSPALTQKVFANMKRVGKRFSEVEMPLFEGMLVAGEIKEQGDAEEQVHDNVDDAAQGADTTVSRDDEALDACAALTRRVEHLEHDKVAQALEIIKLKKKGEEAGKGQQEKKVEDAQVAGDEQVKGSAMLITEVVAAVSESVTAASATIAAVPAATITAAPLRVVAASTRRRKELGKGIMVEEPKPMKKKQQVKIDEEYARKLHEELNQDIDWSVAINHVKQKAKEDPYVQRYQVMKKRPQTEAQARRNMIMYLKNVAGFRLDYFKGMSYDDIRPIFKAKFNSNMEFLLKTKEQMEEEENIAIESINETPAQKAAKRRKLNEEVEDLKQHLEIVPDEDDDVYTKATPLVRKVPVVDYQIIQLNNKPCYKIIRADGTHQLYVSFITLLKNFDREDLESFWSIVKEIFSTLKPNNFSDDYLLTTLRAMFERPDRQDQVWKSQRSVHGQAMVKSWKLLESCGVHIISFTTTQLILLVERRYPLSRFTLDQMLNVVRLRVKKESEISLELLSFGVDAAMDLEEKH